MLTDLVKFVWVNGKLEWASMPFDQLNQIHHMDLLAKLLGSKPKTHEQVQQSGNILMGEAGNGELYQLFAQGNTPSINEVWMQIQQERDKYEDHTYQPISATVEDSEPEFNFGFLDDPHDDLYPCAFESMKMRKDCTNALKAHVFDVIEGVGELSHPGEWIYFTVYGSGASYNWDETGDFDVQMWVDVDKYNEQHQDAPMISDDLVAQVRRAVQTVNFPSFKELNLQTEDCAGDMLIQFYPKAGTGSEEENVASKPYACYDIETNKWLVRPEPITADFYGEHFILVSTKANDIAEQANALITQYQKNVLNWQFWTSLNSKYENEAYEKEADDSKDNATLEQQGIAILFKGVFGGRQEAYSPEGKGMDDERDAIEKLLEVWGIFQELKHYARVPLPWDKQEMPEEPKKESSSNDLQELQQWISEHGPIFYHLIKREEPNTYVAPILNQGLLPRTQLIENGDWHDDEEGKYGGSVWLASRNLLNYSDFDYQYKNMWNEPEGSIPQFAIDVRGLDPSKIAEFHKDGIYTENGLEPSAYIRYEGQIPAQSLSINPELRNRFSFWKESVEYDPTYWQKMNLPTNGAFGYVNYHLILGMGHHQMIMMELINKGWTWEQLMEAPQAWGWFYLNPYEPPITMKIRFTSDAGYQMDESMERAKGAFAERYHLPVELMQPGTKQVYNKDNYGSGLSGKGWQQNYKDKNLDHLLNKTNIIPIPPEGPDDKVFSISYAIPGTDEKGTLLVRALKDEYALQKAITFFAPKHVDVHILGEGPIGQAQFENSPDYIS